MDASEDDGTGCQVFGIPIALTIFATLAILVNLIVRVGSSRLRHLS